MPPRANFQELIEIYFLLSGGEVLQLPILHLRRRSQPDQVHLRDEALRRIRRLQRSLRRGTPVLRESLFRIRK